MVAKIDLWRYLLGKIACDNGSLCLGRRAYAAFAFSYGELNTENWGRLRDDEWQAKITRDPFPDPAWMNDALSK